jgi:hypothetical protein
MTQANLEQALRESLGNQRYVGQDTKYWDELTNVELTLTGTTSVTAPIYKVNTMPNLPIVREQLFVQLLSGEVEVTFTKANGESTKMTCTLVTSSIPADERSKLRVAQEQVPLSLGQLLLETDPLASVASTKPTAATDPNLIVVWSTDRQGWRSFKLDRVTDILVRS